MQEKSQKILLICLEVISLAILLPLFYWSIVKLLLHPIGYMFYPHDLYEYRIVSTWMVWVVILFFDAIWIILMKKYLRGKVHIKVVLTLLILTFSAAVISCFVILDALSW